MKLKPLNNFIAIERFDSPSKTIGGIILPETAKEKLPQGVVIAVGDKVKDIKEGDKVLLSRWAGSEVKIDNKDLLLIKEEEVLAIIN